MNRERDNRGRFRGTGREVPITHVILDKSTPSNTNLLVGKYIRGRQVHKTPLTNPTLMVGRSRGKRPTIGVIVDPIIFTT